MKNRFGKNLISFITVTAILSSFALTPMQAMAFDAPAADDGTANGISNGGEWTIYASKIGEITADSGNIKDVTDSNGVIEVTKEKRSAALQFDLSTKDKESKVIKSAKLRLTPMVSKTNLQQTVSVISNDFTDTMEETSIAQFSIPRVGSDNFNETAALMEISDVTEYPDALSSWQADIDITGEVIGADDMLSLHVKYAGGNVNKAEYATCNISNNTRLNAGAIPFLYNGGETDYSKWIYPQIVFTYTDEADYTAAYNDFLEANKILSEAVVTETEPLSAPAASNSSVITLESADDSGIVTVENNIVAYNPDYVGNESKANVRLTVTNGSASYSKVVSIPVDTVQSYAINFSADKNPMGEISVTVDGTDYTDGTAYAKEGATVTINAAANTGYTANVSVKKESDNSVIDVTDSSFVMPAETVTISAEYAKQSQYGETRIAATNSVSIQSSGNIQTPDLVIGANRVTFVKFDLSGYSADDISRAEMDFTFTKSAGLNTKAVFYVPNNDWDESRIDKNFKLDGTDDTDISSFKYTDAENEEATISLLNGDNHAALIIPDTDDAATAADGILKDYYAASTGTQKTNTISMTEAVTAALKDSEDGIVTFMVYSAGSGNDVYSVDGAPSLASRPSLTIVEEDSENKSYEISFDASKNPKGELSVTVDGINYTDGTAYAKEGATVTINNGANTGYTANITVKKSDGSEIEVTDNSFVMPAEKVSISAEYVKPTFGTSRIAAQNSVSIRDNGAIQSPDLVIGANRITFVKFDLSGYNADIISEADINFTLTKNATLNTKAVFYVPNNDWDESRIDKNFMLDGTEAANISSFQYVNEEGEDAAISLLNGENHSALIVPNTDDAATAAEGILKDYYTASTGIQKTNTISMTEAVKAALKNSEDGIVTFMVYSAGGGNDVYSVNGAPSLASRPSLTIIESSEFLPDDELVTEVKTVEDLETFAAIVNGGNSYAGKTVTLADNLDLSETYGEESGKSWTPIGADNAGGLKSFAGTFDGQEHTISGLYIDESDGIALGLFGDVSGTVKNLTVTGEINGSSVVGGIAASCDGAITNCRSDVTINAQREAGGIVGTLANGGGISLCENTGNIKISNKETYAGGIAGHNIEGIIKDCSNSGKIENGTDGFRNRLGGIAGFLDNGTIESSTNTGEVISNATDASYTGDTTQNYVGGIVGYNSYGTVKSCTNNGRVYNAVPYAGGVAGYLMRGSLLDCSYDETLNSDLEIVGYNEEGTITSGEEPTPDTITVYEENGIIILATYDQNNALLKVEIKGEVKANEEVKETQADENQKVFVWNSLNGMKPVSTKQIPVD